MMVHSACPHCRNECVWSDTSESKYVRCSHCEKTFVISTWGIGQSITKEQRRPRKKRPFLWPWMLLLVLIGVSLGGGLFVQSYDQPKKPEPKVTLENYQRLVVGMNEFHVRKILGFASRRDDSIVPKISNLVHRYKVDSSRFPQRCFWDDGDNVIWVTFVQGKAMQFGATLDGERIGADIQAPLILETFEKDE
jgi:hypothetical protein